MCNTSDQCKKCKQQCKSASLMCNNCKSKIHYNCSEMPVYFIIMLQHSSRKYTCFECAKKVITNYDKHFEAVEVELVNQIQDVEIALCKKK